MLFFVPAKSFFMGFKVNISRQNKKVKLKIRHKGAQIIIRSNPETYSFKIPFKILPKAHEKIVETSEIIV